MSHHHSACVPPPSSYVPPLINPNQDRQCRDRGGRRGGRGNLRRGGGNQRHSSDTALSQVDHTSETDAKSLPQPKDKFYHNEDDDYFAHVEDEEVSEGVNEVKAETSDEEDDPLDAYMKSLEKNNDSNTMDQAFSANSVEQKPPHQSVSSSSPGFEIKASSSSSAGIENDKKGVRLDIDSTEDLEESYFKYVEQIKLRQTGADDLFSDQRELVEYDNFGNPTSIRKMKREVDPLPPVDHSTMTYEAFDRHFYQEHDEIQRLTQDQSDELRSKLEIRVHGRSVPKPVCSFAHFKFDEQLMKVIRRSDYTQPTPIQAQAIPAILSGRNVIGIAMTGSGKTAAYLWPMIIHINNQPSLKNGDGPIGLILVPTRELAIQVYTEAKKFSQTYKMKVICAYGGGSKYLQSEDLKCGAEIVVATPGRLIDLVKLGATSLNRVSYMVLDEADRFFDMGFEAQVRSICANVRPDRQTLLFSATFKKKIEQLALSVTEDPIKIVQKSLGEANEDVTQHVIVFRVASSKWSWLNSKLIEFTSAGSVLIFVTRIANCEELHNNLKQQGRETLLLHGDMEQSERNRVISSFRRKENEVLIATDVAARGLDIAHIKTVINYDVPRDIDTHTHRIGRTGRAGTKGDAYTLMTDKDKEFAGHLVKNLESSSQLISDDLMKLAMQSQTFRRLRRDPKSGSRDFSYERRYHGRDFHEINQHRSYGVSSSHSRVYPNNRSERDSSRQSDSWKSGHFNKRHHDHSQFSQIDLPYHQTRSGRDDQSQRHHHQHKNTDESLKRQRQS